MLVPELGEKNDSVNILRIDLRRGYRPNRSTLVPSAFVLQVAPLTDLNVALAPERPPSTSLLLPTGRY